MIFSGTTLKDLSKRSVLIILIGFIATGGAFYAFAELAGEVLEQEKFAVDQYVTELVRQIQTPWLSVAMGWITDAGSVIWITVASILFFAYLLFFSSKSRWIAIYFAVSMLGISLLTKLLKLTFERQRPSVLEEYDGTGFSFPSGHSTGSIVFYGFILYYVLLHHLRKGWKVLIVSLLIAAIVFIGLSRVYLGVHYFTDVMAGFAFGLSWLLICISSLEWTVWRQRRRQKN
ncbi:hypothetical protein N781_02305 [Pontibacillus halophilus JSM 076056 = DSM 19796]|uniref:Phosphatidic acid phosphatase type 2/haloperoxidase domain-containing protein n=1 Tax=Pontibacillus halophilus JSM 076056 = DSM 19796 TaxID=1385510 RepID=A0A0A5IDY5_9BACI|nr:phosphatase PAP2 family protein [Pontibacillus halophilus]KGX94022.1 hypothetical protein N781_02305 [Pontibacillus halophilus JSM 076056 = DSM 19796]